MEKTFRDVMHGLIVKEIERQEKRQPIVQTAAVKHFEFINTGAAEVQAVLEEMTQILTASWQPTLRGDFKPLAIQASRPAYVNGPY